MWWQRREVASGKVWAGNGAAKRRGTSNQFLKLSWQGNESAEEILDTIQKDRANSARFETENALFD